MLTGPALLAALSLALAAPSDEVETASGEPEATAPDAPAPRPPRGAPAASAPTPEEIAELEAAALYRIGLQLAASERWDEACATLTRVWMAYPDSPWAAPARDKADLVGAAAPGSGCAPRGAGDGLTTDDADDGRVELVITQSIVAPILVGGLLPAAVGAPLSVEGGVLLTFAGLGAGMGGTLALTSKHPVSSGQAMAVGTGELLGTFNGLALATLSQPANPEPVFGATAGGLVLGGALGTLAAVGLDPSAGDVALVRSGANWGAYLGGLSFAFVPGGDMTQDWSRMIAAVDAGAVVGIIAAGNLEMSRRRVNLVNVGGYAGTLVGFGIAAIVSDNTDGFFDGPEALITLAGTSAGIGVAAHATRDARPGRGRVPAPGALLVHDDGWALGLPVVLPQTSPDGHLVPSVPLAQGRL